MSNWLNEIISDFDERIAKQKKINQQISLEKRKKQIQEEFLEYRD